MKRNVVVIGGGPNGLAAAARLARGDRRVVLLERRPLLGGTAAGEIFHDGYRSNGLLSAGDHVTTELARELDLERHGLAFADAPQGVVALERDGPGLPIYRDPARAHEKLAARSAQDAAAYADWRAFLDRIGPFIARVLAEPPPDLEPGRPQKVLELLRTGVALRRLGQDDMLELLRVGPMCAADWMQETFETPLLSAALTVPGVSGTWLGPWSAGSAALLLFHAVGRGRPVRGGPAAIATALARCAKSAGVELRTESTVETILVERGKVRGVRLEGGETIASDVVISTLEPKRTLLDLVPRIELPPQLEAAILPWRTRGTTSALFVALNELPASLAERVAEHGLDSAVTGESVDELERAFDAIKYGEESQRPFLELSIPSLSDPTLAPAGGHVLSLLAHFTPHAVEGGWSTERRDALQQRVLDTLEVVAPGTQQHIVGVETLSPPDLEERYGLTGGHVHHGEHALDQLLFLRPGLDCARYATPIEGLFFGGSGSHPGGGRPGAAGLLAASALGTR